MHRSMVRQSFQTLCHINELMYPRISLINAAKLRIYLKCPVDRHIQFHRHHFCQSIHLCIWEIKRFSDRFDDTSRRHGTECHNLRHRILTIFFRYIFDYAGTLRILEIHVNIRHGYTLRIQETLKQKVVTYRINIRNSCTVTYTASGTRTSSRTYPAVMCFRPVDIIPNNKDIFYKAHGLYNTKLIFHILIDGVALFFGIGCIVRIFFCKALITQRPQKLTG